jgi:hypothetical protein
MGQACCASIGRKKKEGDAGTRVGKNHLRFSFRLPANKGEQVCEDSAGNPLFVSWDAAGNTTVKDLGGNVLEVVSEPGRMIAIYGAAPPPCTERKQQPPPAATTTTSV